MEVDTKKPLASLGVVSEFVEVILPEYKWYIQHIKNAEDHLPKELRSALAELDIEDYSKFYTDRPAMDKLFSEVFLENLENHKDNIRGEPQKVQQRAPLDDFLINLKQVSIDQSDHLDINLGKNEVEEREFLKGFLTWIMVWIHDLTALMVFGESIASIAPKAITGERSAIFKLVQIDPSTLRYIPEISEQHQRAAMQKDKYYLKSFNHYLCNRVGTSKLKHNLVYIPLFLLHNLRLLDGLSNRELLEFCDRAGLIKYEEIPDARTMGLIRKRFLEGMR